MAVQSIAGVIFHSKRGMPMKKLMIVSDIHGSAYWCGRMLECFEREGCDRMLILGDILYHGPRNDLPRDYAPKKVMDMLNAVQDRIFCVRGNCDGEVDQMVLEFPIMAEYAVFVLGSMEIYATHGHKYNEKTPPPLKSGILLYGHTHVPVCRGHECFTAMNPGSVSIPKEGSPHSCMIWESGLFTWRDLENGAVYKEMAF